MRIFSSLQGWKLVKLGFVQWKRLWNKDENKGTNTDDNKEHNTDDNKETTMAITRTRTMTSTRKYHGQEQWQDYYE